MRSLLSYFVPACLTLLCGSASLLAAEIASDNFNSYAAGALSPQTGGTGWSGGWTAPTPTGGTPSTITFATVEDISGDKKVKTTLTYTTGAQGASTVAAGRLLAIPLASTFYVSYKVAYAGPSGGFGGNNTFGLIVLDLTTNPFFPRLRSGHRLVLEPSPQKQFLSNWSQSSDDAIQHYSGPATYRMRFNVAPTLTKESLFLSLGQVKEMARVKLNGRDLGVVWCPPWNVRIPAGTLVEKDNKLEIEVVNFWPNRLIGDTKLPPQQRRTKTNITKFEDPKDDAHYTTLMPAGLLGPVTLQTMTINK